MKYRIRSYNGLRVDPKVFELRHEVFVVEQEIPEKLDRDENDARSIHVGLYDNQSGEIIATGRMTIKLSEAVLARIAVSASHRGMGLGKVVVQKLEELALPFEPQQYVLHPHVHLKGFYQSLGYELKSTQIIEIANVKLFRMEKPV